MWGDTLHDDVDCKYPPAGDKNQLPGKRKFNE